MNAGNKQRGQADGFEIDAINKAFSIKDINGASMMSTVCQKIFEKDENFLEFKPRFSPCYTSLKSKVDDVKSESDKAKGLLTANISMFDLVRKVDPEVEDQIFGKQIDKFLKEIEKKVDKLITGNNTVADKYNECCDFFMMNANDELRKKSDKFFIFWTEFIDEVTKCIPKPEKKPTGNTKAAAMKKAAGDALMKELMAKQNVLKK